MEQFEGITFNYNGQDTEIPFSHIEELISFKNMKPVIVVAGTDSDRNIGNISSDVDK